MTTPVSLNEWPENICADRHETSGKWVLHYLTDEQAKLCHAAMGDEKEVKDSMGQEESDIAPESAGLEPECIRLSPASGYVELLETCKTALSCLVNATMYKDHPFESQLAIDTIAIIDAKMGVK